MFKLQAEPTFWAKAPISVPGQAAPVPLDVEYRWLGREQLRAFLDTLAERSDIDLLGEIVVGWKGVDAPFSVDALARLIDQYPRAADAIFDTWRSELLEAKAKN